ncbi:MAG: GIY-YIG nuclease family protein [Lewinella sp.]|nr:GIY-YIG nuclease family protein [Lewinella sp.]
MYFVYVLYSTSTDRLYRGQTADLQDRLNRHNLQQEKATAQGAPWILLWHTSKPDRSQAVLLETKLKNLSRKRMVLFMQKYQQGITGPDEALLLQRLSGC